MRWLTLLFALSACSKHVAMGEVCTKAVECGNGADCYRGVCTPMCANDSECQDELVCARHRCLLATGEPRRNTPLAAPVDERTAAELRAIRHELDQIRAEQQRQREAIEKLQRSCTPPQ